MTKYGVWFLGNDQERAGVCYQGRNVFLADTELEAALYKEDLESYSELNKGRFKVYKLEVEK